MLLSLGSTVSEKTGTASPEGPQSIDMPLGLGSQLMPRSVDRKTPLQASVTNHTFGVRPPDLRCGPTTGSGRQARPRRSMPQRPESSRRQPAVQHAETNLRSPYCPCQSWSFFPSGSSVNSRRLMTMSGLCQPFRSASSMKARRKSSVASTLCTPSAAANT